MLVFGIIFGISFATCLNVFFDFTPNGLVPYPFGVSQILFFVIFGVIFIVAYIFALFNFSYVIEDKYFAVRRFKKEICYDYKNIEFIDIETSRRKRQVIFYTKGARMRYLLGDKDGVLLETLIKKCPNVMSVEEFRTRHPEERY